MRYACGSFPNSDLLGSGNYFTKEDKILTSGLVPTGQISCWEHFPHFPLVKYRGKMNISWLLLLEQSISQTLELKVLGIELKLRKVVEKLMGVSLFSVHLGNLHCNCLRSP